VQKIKYLEQALKATHPHTYLDSWVWRLLPSVCLSVSLFIHAPNSRHENSALLKVLDSWRITICG
jgi:hypothetical protein